MQTVRRFAPATVAAISAIAVIGTGLAASIPRSPLAETVPGVQALGALETFAERLAFPADQGALMGLTIALLALAAVTFIISSRLAWRGRITVRMAVTTGIVLHLLVLPAPVLFSEDVFNYVMYGRIVTEHASNPYVSVPDDFPEDPLVPYIGYQDDTSVYGPAFTALSAGVTASTHSTAASVWIFKVIAVLSSVGAMLMAVLAARRIRPERAAFAAVVIGWNPVVILHSVGGAHNDTLVALCLAAGCFLVLTSRLRAATLCVVLGVLVKAIVVVPLIVLAVGILASTAKGRRLRVSATHVAIGVGAFLLFATPFLQTENPTLGVLSASGRFLGESGAVRAIARAAGLDSIAEPLARVAQGIVPFVVLSTVLLVGFHLVRRGTAADGPTIVAGMGWVLVVSVLFSDQHFPWYGMWIVPLAWVLPRAARGAVLVTSAALTLMHPFRPPSGVDPWILWVFYAALAVIGVVLLRVMIELTSIATAKTPADGESKLIEEGKPRLPLLLAPLRWLDAAAPPANPGT